MTDLRTSDRYVSRAIRSWLHEDRHEDVSRVAGAVLDQLDTTPQRRARWWLAWRTPSMNKFVTIGVGAAAVVVVALLLGTQLFESPGGTGAGEEHPTATAKLATAEPPAASALPVGPLMILDGDHPEPIVPSLTVTIPAPGWNGTDEEDGERGGMLFKKWGDPDGAGMIIFTQQEYYVFRDPCNWETSIPDTPVTTVDEFVTALSSQASRNATEPVDISVGGYTGKSITLHVPDDADFSQCDQRVFGIWDCGSSADQTPCALAASPGETSTEYILDVGEGILAWHTSYGPEAPAEVVAELEAIVQSAIFGE